MTVGSLATATAGRPSTRPRPVITPSAGKPPAVALASWASSTNVSGSNSSAKRSRTYSLCWRASLAAPASVGLLVAASASANRRATSLIASPVSRVQPKTAPGRLAVSAPDRAETCNWGCRRTGRGWSNARTGAAPVPARRPDRRVSTSSGDQNHEHRSRPTQPDPARRAAQPAMQQPDFVAGACCVPCGGRLHDAGGRGRQRHRHCARHRGGEPNATAAAVEPEAALRPRGPDPVPGARATARPRRRCQRRTDHGRQHPG